MLRLVTPSPLFAEKKVVIRHPQDRDGIIAGAVAPISYEVTHNPLGDNVKIYSKGSWGPLIISNNSLEPDTSLGATKEIQSRTYAKVN